MTAPLRPPLGRGEPPSMAMTDTRDATGMATDAQPALSQGELDAAYTLETARILRGRLNLDCPIPVPHRRLRG